MRRALLVIAAAAFLLRLGYAIATGVLWHPQFWEQERIATNLVERHEFVRGNDRAYAEPLYPFVAAAVYAVTGHSRTALLLLQLAVAAATVWLAGRLAGMATGDERAGLAAASLMAVDPAFVYYNCVLHPLTFDTFFFTAAALALVCRRWFTAAALIGAGVLTRPTILLLSLFQRRIVAVALTLAIIAPWTIRNAVVLHDFVLTRSGTGYVFWLGNNPDATGGANDAQGRPLLDRAPRKFLEAGEVERDRLFRQAALDYVAARPFAAIGRVVQRLYYFWWFAPSWGIHYSSAAKGVYRVWWSLLLLLIIAGAFLTRRREVWLLAAMALLVSLVQSVYYVEGRHRLAVEPLVLPLAALSLSAGGPRWLQSQRSGSRSSSPP